MINATFCYLTSINRVLFICRRKAGDIHEGLYVPPGGHTKRGERGIDCVMREYKEETDLTLSNPKLRAIVTFYNQGRIMGGVENPEDWCVEIYEASDYSGTRKAEHPEAEPVWVPEEEINNIKMYPGDRKIFELIRKERGVLEVLVQYEKKELVRFEWNRVA